jgi:Flp pilus assembly pilin Flp
VDLERHAVCSFFPSASILTRSGAHLVGTASGRFGHSQRGQGLVEYVALVAVIGTALVLVMGLLGQATGNAYRNTAKAVSRETGHPYGGSGSGAGGYSGTPYIPVSAPPKRRPQADSASSADPSDDLGAGHAGM